MTTLVILFFLYLFAHCIADTSFQTDAMATGKNRNRPIDMSRVPKGQKPLNLWYMWLTHHSAVHGGIAFLITYIVTHNFVFSGILAIIEFVSHWIIDFGKCENKYSPIGDQLLHLGMKVGYVFAVTKYSYLVITK